jgi:hypothetical protein
LNVKLGGTYSDHWALEGYKEQFTSHVVNTVTKTEYKPVVNQVFTRM